MAVSTTHGGKPSSASSSLSTQYTAVKRAVEEVEALKQMAPLSPLSPLPIVEDSHNSQDSQEIVSETVQWWASRAHNFPLFAQLARRVLTVPRLQVQSKRLFSSAGLIVMKTCNSLKLLVSLRITWPAGLPRFSSMDRSCDPPVFCFFLDTSLASYGSVRTDEPP